MSLLSAAEYQRAFGDLLRSPALCRELRRHGPDATGNGPEGSNGPDSPDPLDGYHLTSHERARLRAVSRHRGMVVNCTLYRASRLVGITRRLPGTVDALGPALLRVFDAYLVAQPDAEPEFDREARNFAVFVAAQPSLDATVRDVLNTEIATLPNQRAWVNGPG